VNARALYDGLAREAGNLICAVPGGTERPKVLLRYHGWLSREGHEHVGQALADVLGAKQLIHVVERLLTQEEVRQQCRLPEQEPLPRLPLVEILKNCFDYSYNRTEVKNVRFPDTGYMLQIATAFESHYRATGQTKALLCTHIRPWLIPVYRDQQEQWQARVPDEKYPGMTTRPLSKVMEQQQAAWNASDQTAKQTLDEIAQLSPTEQQEQAQQDRRAEAEKTLKEIAERRIQAEILTRNQWPDDWPLRPRIYWEKDFKRARFQFHNPLTQKATNIQALPPNGKSKAAKAQAEANLQAYAVVFHDKYRGGATIEKAKEAAEAHLEKIGVVQPKRNRAAHTSEMRGVYWYGVKGKTDEGHWRFRVPVPGTSNQRQIYSAQPRGKEQAAIDAAMIKVEEYAVQFKAIYEKQETKDIEQAKDETDKYMQRLQDVITADQS
jgi:hypothetical protein